MCERGHLNLARGHAADDILERAVALAREVDAGPTSSLGRAVERLSSAVRRRKN